MMKALLMGFIGFFSALFLLHTDVEAGCSRCPKPKPPKSIECNKTYIQGPQIKIADEEIYINFNDQVVRTSAIYVDEIGFFFKDLYDDGCPDGLWECRNCHACNDRWNNYCQVCWK